MGQSDWVTESDLSRLVLEVYDTKLGWWTPGHGEVEIPTGWEFLASGDAFLTRSVKAAGVYWLAWLPRRRGRPHRRKIGLWAPADAIADAVAKAEATEEARARSRKLNAVSRDRQGARDQHDLAEAVIAFLAFAPQHRGLAERIAREASARAAVVGSGRVGRTRTLRLEERAALAARAYIRHRFTDYEDQLEESWGEIGDDDAYRDIKREAQAEVDEFLAAHRP